MAKWTTVLGVALVLMVWGPPSIANAADDAYSYEGAYWNLDIKTDDPGTST
jgi:hypothetical protein